MESIARDILDRHREISWFLTQVMERPAVQRSPLGLAKPYPLADALEVFQGDAALGALGLGHDAFADAVVDVEGRYFYAPPPQQRPAVIGFTSRPHRGLFALVGFFVGFRQWKFADERT